MYGNRSIAYMFCNPWEGVHTVQSIMFTNLTIVADFEGEM